MFGVELKSRVLLLLDSSVSLPSGTSYKLSVPLFRETGVMSLKTSSGGRREEGECVCTWYVCTPKSMRVHRRGET